MLTNLVSGFNGDAPFIATFPAKAKGLSYQVLIIGPPYISVLSLTYFPSDIIWGFGLTLKPGASVCAPINLNPVSSMFSSPTTKAIIEESFFIT